MINPVTRHTATLLVFALLLTACGSQPPSGPGAIVSKPVTGKTTPAIAGSEGEHTALLDKIERLLLQRQTLAASSILTPVDYDKLTLDEQVRFSLLWAQLYYLQGNVSSALASLSMEQSRFSDMSPDLRWQVQREYLQLLTASGATLQGARLANQWLANTTDPQQRTFLVDDIWHRLQSTDVARLEDERKSAAQDPYWRGWLDLSLIAAGTTDSPDVQVAEIQLWQQQYKTHPLAKVLPGGLEMLGELAQARPHRLALLLPLSNSLAGAGQAILDGFLAAQYQATDNGWESQQLLILDMDRYPDVNDAYRAAVERGAELVIGPLAREELDQWVPPLTADAVPLLALNWMEQQPADAEPIYQLALAPEDEARQIAELAFDEGARQALLIRPAGAWGDAVSGAFVERWLELRGELRSSAIYSDRNDYSSSIKTALNLGESEARAERIRQLMGSRVEFTPRRRQDIDSVFLLSGQPAEARSIKPLVAFHYAADLPVYSTSQVFSGQPNPQRDRDLNGVRLLQMPWLLEQGSLQQTINASGSNETLADMYAMGADAFLLHWRLGQLRASTSNSLRGHTGLLSMDERGRIHRQLLAATFSDGVPVPLH